MKNKKFVLTSMGISVLSIIPFAFILRNVLEFIAMTIGGSTYPVEKIEEILGRTISSPAFLYPFIFMIIFVIINSVIAAILFKKAENKSEKWYAGTLLIFGGLGIPAIQWLVFCRKPSEKNKSISRSGKIRGTLLLSVTASVAAPVAIFSFSYTKDTFEKATHLKSVSLSSNSNAINLVEVFTDGFDPWGQEPLIKNSKTFKDFYVYTKNVTSGINTENSKPAMYAGLYGRNNFAEIERRHNTGRDSMSLDNYIYKWEFAQSDMAHMNSEPLYNKPGHKYVINPLNMANASGYMAATAGDARFVHKEDPDIGVVNFTQAKNEEATGGISNYSPDAVMHKWLTDHIKKTNDPIGSRVLVQDLLSHPPRVTNPDGTINWTIGAGNTSGTKQGFAGAFGTLTRLVEQLKKQGVYDNTMIVIYGDHSDHSRHVIEKGEPQMTESEKNHSLMIIKYPHSENTTSDQATEVNDRTLYTPLLSDIIKTTLAGARAKKDHLENYIKTDSKFDLDRNFLSFNGVNGFYTKFVGDSLQLDSTAGVNKTGWISYDDYKYDDENDHSTDPVAELLHKELGSGAPWKNS